MLTTAVEDAAKWFIKNDYDSPRNTRDGNMKLQKMLYFTQLVHLAKYGEPYFEEEVLAFKDGSVVEEVRQRYLYQNGQFVLSAYMDNISLSSNQIDSLTIVEQVFGTLTGRELSDLNHLHVSWNESYERSKTNTGYYNKSEAVISLKQMRDNELETIGEIIKAYEINKESIDCYEFINDTKFYYDPSVVTLDSELIAMLESFNGPDSAYTIYNDEEAGIVIF